MHPRSPHPVVSIVFDRREPLEGAIASLMEHGIARDLIEIVTGPATARRFFGDAIPLVPQQMLSDAGRGALIGLVASSILSALLVLVVPMAAVGPLTLVQALGPNVGTLGGAAIGILVGALRPREPQDLYCRIRQTGGILMLVHCRSRDQAERLQGLLEPLGGHDGRIVSAT